MYFYHTWKTVAHSPFANAIVFVDDSATISALTDFDLTVTDVSKIGNIAVVNLVVDEETSLQQSDVQLVQTKDLTEDGVGVQKFGSYLLSKDAKDKGYVLEANIGEVNYITATAITLSDLSVGDKVTFAKES